LVLERVVNSINKEDFILNLQKLKKFNIHDQLISIFFTFILYILIYLQKIRSTDQIIGYNNNIGNAIYLTVLAILFYHLFTLLQAIYLRFIYIVNSLRIKVQEKRIEVLKYTMSVYERALKLQEPNQRC